jgi:hypothetical protein
MIQVRPIPKPCSNVNPTIDHRCRTRPERIKCNRPGEHRKPLAWRDPLFLITECRRAIRQHDNVETAVIGRAHGGLDATIRQEATNGDFNVTACPKDEMPPSEPGAVMS